MQNIIQYIVNPETNGTRETSFLPSDQAQKLISSYDEAAKASVDIMNDLSQLGASLAPNTSIPPINGHQNISQQQSLQHPVRLQDQTYSRAQSSPSYSVKSVKSDAVKQEYRTPSRDGRSSSATTPDSNAGRPLQRPHPPPQVDTSSHDDFNTFDNFQFPPEQPAGDSQNTGGLRVYTVGHFAPRQEDGEDEPENPSFQTTPANMHVVKDTDDRSAHTLKVRRQTFVPGWAVPPKILLVDDDVVYRNMSSKFLQVFGCEADVAVDGFSALDKVNVEKYDLILMDVVMPNLDGVTTTGMIRQFDSATPIISMTSNIKTNDIMHYFNSGSTLLRCCLTVGMNDVLPKPFTKDSLLGMLEKHLLHMKQMQQMQQLGYPVATPSIAPQTNSQRVVELSPKDQQKSSPLQHQALDDTLNLEDPNLQFAYNPNFNILFETPVSTTSYPRSQQLPLTSAKRRTASDMDAYEYLDHSINVPRSTGNMNPSNGKRPRYNTPPY